MLRLPDALVLIAALLVAIAYAGLARGEVVTWAVPADDPLETFELCTAAGCDPIGFTRFHDAQNALGDVFLYQSDVELDPGVRAWVRGLRGGVGGVPVEPTNPIRIWCSPWDFSGDGFIGIIDYLRWMIGGFEGGLEGRANLSRVYAERCNP